MAVLMVTVMLMLMMLIQMVTMLRYVEKNIVVRSRTASPKPLSRSRMEEDGVCQTLCHLKHTPEITRFMVSVAMPVAIPLDTQSDT